MSDTKIQLWKPQVIVSILLLIALLPQIPYGYYICLRIVTCVLACCLAWKLYAECHDYTAYLLGTIALIYNPIIRFHFTKEIWSIINISTILIFLITIIQLRKTSNTPASENKISDQQLKDLEPYIKIAQQEMNTEKGGEMFDFFMEHSAYAQEHKEELEVYESVYRDADFGNMHDNFTLIAKNVARNYNIIKNFFPQHFPTEYSRIAFAGLLNASTYIFETKELTFDQVIRRVNTNNKDPLLEFILKHETLLLYTDTPGFTKEEVYDTVCSQKARINDVIVRELAHNTEDPEIKEVVGMALYSSVYKEVRNDLGIVQHPERESF